VPGNSDWVSPAQTFPEIFSSGLRLFASTRLYCKLLVRASGSALPTQPESSLFGHLLKTHISMANVVFNGGAKNLITARPVRRE
jgi:hypothetical protein